MATQPSLRILTNSDLARYESIEIRDVQIAGIALARKASIATRNIRHFEGLGIPLIDPWSA